MLGLSHLATSLLAAFVEPERIPNEHAIALSPTIGWLMLMCALAGIAMFLAQHDRWRRFWLTAEDPRPMAAFRIIFAFLVICNINDVFEYFTMLFTDEGIFFSDVARQVFAAGQFKGFGDGLGENDPYGFFDANGTLLFFLGHKYSLLFFWDTPQGFTVHLWLFYVITALFMIGWRTRLMGVLSYLLMNSLFIRNPLFWEGTELVYRVFFFYLIVSRCGHAYSVDNWLRCRRLRKRGLLSTRDGPGGGAGVAPSEQHPKGLAAVYRLIPAWPRWLAILNLAALYCYTGVVKNGSVWARGDALYYALNMDHFYRFYPQELSSMVGTNLFRLATWITHWWEACFPLMVVGLIYRWREWEHEKPLEGWRLWFVRGCWVLFGLGCGALTVVALPVHLPGNYNHAWWQRMMSIWWLVFMFGLWLVWRLLAGPLKIRLGERTITLRTPGPFEVTIRGVKLKLSRPIDRRMVCTWVLGRRVWLTLGLLFHGNLHLLMNIGMFPPIMMSTYAFCLKGDEPGRLLRFIGYRLLWWCPLVPKGVREGQPPLPAEDRALPHHPRDDRALPTWALWATLGGAVLGILLEYFHVQKFGWTAMAIGFGLLGYAYYQGHRGSKRLVPGLLGLGAAMLAYTWLLHQEGEAWTWIKLYVHLAVLGLWLLSYIPTIRALYATLGLTLSAPDRDPADGELPMLAPDSDHVRAPWAYGPAGRLFAGAFIVWHIIAVGVWLMPDKDVLSKWDIQAKHVFRRYLLTTGTDQAWGMFAPNPPRHNVFLRTVVTDTDDEKWDLRTDLYAWERKPIPWIWNDRMRKMNRRIIGGESGKGDWYQKWYARYLCREWARAHRGRPPKKIELFRVSYLMPSPEQVKTRGWYKPEELILLRGRESLKYAESCRSGINAQLPNYIRERYGLPTVDEKTVKMWEKKRKEKWEKRNEFEQDPTLDNLKRVQSKIRAEQRKRRREASKAARAG